MAEIDVQPDYGADEYVHPELRNLAGELSEDELGDIAARCIEEFKLDEQSRREWEAIQEALARMASGTYGDCTTCGKAIESARLEAMPMARRCTYCQEVAEKAGNVQ